MAKAEFFEIVIKDKKENIILEDITLNTVISKYLNTNTEHENFCQNKKCGVILSNHIIHDENSITFDFTKLTDEKIISTLISKPTVKEDTFERYNQKLLETTTYTDKEKQKVEELISLYENEELINQFKLVKIEEFKIYKIILEHELLKNEALTLFNKQIIKRLTSNSTYFNIRENYENSNAKILIYQNIVDGADIKFLETYLNTHLLINENFKVYFHKLFDADFMDLLQNGELTSFKFSYTMESKNNLLDKDLFNPLYALNNLFNNNITKVEIKPNEEDVLDNKKLIDFFEKASDNGLLDSCELKKKGGGNKTINFQDKKLNIDYTENINLEDIHEADLFFNRGLSVKKKIIKQRLGL